MRGHESEYCHASKTLAQAKVDDEYSELLGRWKEEPYKLNERYEKQLDDQTAREASPLKQRKLSDFGIVSIATAEMERQRKQVVDHATTEAIPEQQIDKPPSSGVTVAHRSLEASRWASKPDNPLAEAKSNK